MRSGAKYRAAAEGIGTGDAGLRTQWRRKPETGTEYENGALWRRFLTSDYEPKAPNDRTRRVLCRKHFAGLSVYVFPVPNFENRDLMVLIIDEIDDSVLSLPHAVAI